VHRRYARQIALWGEKAQQRLLSSTALVVGLGGLGSAAATYLAAAGVGRLLLVDFDRVESSDLNRQVLHWAGDVGRLKVESAAEKLRQLNPEVKLEPLPSRLDSAERARRLVENTDVVLDCLDNWVSRFLLNEACVEAGKPMVHAAVEGLSGWVTLVYPRRGPCLRCMFPRDPPERGSVPVAGPLPGVLGALEALEAVKLLAGFGEPLVGRMLYYDGATGSAEVLSVTKRPSCPVCGHASASSP